ncbi:hypothetical protein ACN079_27575 [Pseudomonas sp. ABY48]|uniref:hypothetical protein n=1 Tax=Pseudomonas sp. ABY48 TaxID=3402865 RepID=UPI003B43C158
MKRLLLTAVLTVLMIAEVHAESFTISDIRVNGLQRVSAGSVFGALPLNVGEQADDRRLVESTRALFKTGFFQDIQLGRGWGDQYVSWMARRSLCRIRRPTKRPTRSLVGWGFHDHPDSHSTNIRTLIPR